MGRLSAAVAECKRTRSAIQKSYMERLQTRLQEVMATQADGRRVLQEAAVLVDRSDDIQEELVAAGESPCEHFLAVPAAHAAGSGKQLDFLLQR